MTFRARIHQKQLAPIWNDFFMFMMANNIQGRMEPKFSRHLSYGWGNTSEKSLNQGNWPDRGSNPGLLGDGKRCYPSTTGNLLVLNIISLLMFSALFLHFRRKQDLYDRARWLRGDARDSHSGGPGFESRCRPTWLGFFSWFSSGIKANAGLDFHYHDPFDHYSSNSYIIKLNQWTLTNETLTTQQ